MATSSKYWFNSNQPLYQLVNSKNNGCIVLTLGTYNNFAELLREKGGILTSLFNDPSQSTNSIRLYPFYNTNLLNPNLFIPKVFDTIYNDTTTTNGVTTYKYYCSSLSERLRDSVIHLGEWLCTPKFNNFMDYTGYTKFKIWLPYFGFIELEPNELMNKYVNFLISIDVYTGKAVYYITTSDSELTSVIQISSAYEYYPYIDKGILSLYNTKIISTYEFQLGIDIPIGQSSYIDNMRNLAFSGLKIAANLAGHSIGNMLFPATTSTTTSSTSGTTTKTYDIQGRGLRKGSRMKQIKSGNETTTTSETTSTTRSLDLTAYGKRQMIEEAFNGTAEALANFHATNASDRISTPSLISNGPTSIIILRYTPKVQEIDSNYNALYGKPFGKVVQLNTLKDTGYTEISNIRLENSYFNMVTNEELAGLRNILNTGIIL